MAINSTYPVMDFSIYVSVYFLLLEEAVKELFIQYVCGFYIEQYMFLVCFLYSMFNTVFQNKEITVKSHGGDCAEKKAIPNTDMTNSNLVEL